MFEVNYWAVLVAGLAVMFIGAFWYSPLFFGNTWMKLSGITMADLEKMKKKGMAASYFIAFVGTLVMAYVFDHFNDLADANTVAEGLQTGFWIWLGFVATNHIGMVLWERKPWSLFFIHTGHSLVSLLVAGAILAVWQ